MSGTTVMVPVIELKTCNSCLKELPTTKYKRRGKTGRQSHTLHSMCNQCLYIKYTRPNAEKKIEEVRKYKLEKGCIDCGYNLHPEALEFDHKPNSDKLFNIGEKLGSYSMEKIWEEINKCEVVCANCHAIRTANRRTRIEIEVM
jgi:hypothetical protein